MTENSLKISHKFVCKKCDYSTSKKSDYSKHLFTLKHQNNDNDDINNDNPYKNNEELINKLDHVMVSSSPPAKSNCHLNVSKSTSGLVQIPLK